MNRCEHRVFTGAAAVALTHAVDDAFLNRQPGVPLGRHVLAASLALAIGAAVYVITNVLYEQSLAAWVAGVLVSATVLLWYALPQFLGGASDR